MHLFFHYEENFDDTPLQIIVYPKSRSVSVSWGEKFYTSPLITSRISGNIDGNTSNNITLVFGRLNITNSLGEIQLAQ